MAKQSVFVVPHGGGWAVRRTGNDRVSSMHGTKEQAVTAGRRAAKADHTELVVQNRDGKIGQKDSFGNDPHPPKG